MPAPFCEELYRQEYRFDGKIMASGYPRNDALVGPGREEVRARTRQLLGIAESQTAVLYAPTWRESLSADTWNAPMFDALDIDEMATRLGSDHVILLRGHNHNLGDAARFTDHATVLDVTDYPEINELILASDVAVLDYSSLRFDYALTGRPMVFFVPDLEDYVANRSFLFDYEPTAPGPWARTTREVVDALSDLAGTDREYAAPSGVQRPVQPAQRRARGRASDRRLGARSRGRRSPLNSHGQNWSRSASVDRRDRARPRTGATVVVLGLTGTAVLLTLAGLPGVALAVLAVAALADGLAVPAAPGGRRGEQLGRPGRRSAAPARAAVDRASRGCSCGPGSTVVAGGGRRRGPAGAAVAGGRRAGLGPAGSAPAPGGARHGGPAGAPARAAGTRGRADGAPRDAARRRGVRIPRPSRPGRDRRNVGGRHLRRGDGPVGAARAPDPRGAAPRLAAAQAYLNDVAPEVVLYYGDSEKSVHEVAMWLPVLEVLPQRTLVLVRNRAAFDALPQTTAPVLCVPSAQDLLGLDLGVLRVGLFVSNIGNNIHLLRQPGLRTVFIGHGDSDKSASVNPFSKVYDEIWVAGAGGPRALPAADAGARTTRSSRWAGRSSSWSRPAAGRTVRRSPRVLYAPTWEGWNADQDYCSVATHGEALVRGLLAHPAPVRLLYRPHPYTGRRRTRRRRGPSADRRLCWRTDAAAGLPHLSLPSVARQK